MAGFIQCNYGGGGGGPEIIEGTIEGAVNTQWTVSSQQGKAPKLAAVWMSTPHGSIQSGCYWSANFLPNKYFGQFLNGGTYGANQTNVGTGNNYNPDVMSIGADSITFKFGTSAAYVNGTFSYRVEFE